MDDYKIYRVENCGGFVFGGTEREGPDCLNYYPGMLADIEEDLGERRDREFEEAFLGGREC